MPHRASCDRTSILLLLLESDPPATHSTPGLILTRQNRPVEACALFETALRLEPRFEEARRHLAKIEPGDLTGLGEMTIMVM